MDKLLQWRYNFKTDEFAKFRGCSCYMLIYYCKIDEDFIALLVNKGPSRNEITVVVIKSTLLQVLVQNVLEM